MTVNRFDSLISSWELKIRQAFLSSIYSIRDGAQIDLIEKLMKRGDIEGAIRAVGLDPTKFRVFDSTVAKAYESGGWHTSSHLPKLREPSGHKIEIVFDVRNVSAEAWLRDHSSNAIKEIVNDQRTMIRDALRDGMEAGENPRTVALDLVGKINKTTGRREGGLIGLTSSQEKWVREYAKEVAAGDSKALLRKLRDKRFDPAIKRAIKNDSPIPAKQQEAMVRAYKNRALKYRADTIARTEAMASLHEAQNEAMKQAIEKGQVDLATVKKVWHSAGDGRVRDTHAALNGKSVSFNSSFVSPSGARLKFPGDPSAPAAEIINCRCWSDIKIDFLHNIR